jgi:hypothetical protein
MSDILQSKSKTNQSSQKEQFWVKHIKLKQASGLTRAAYCRTHGLVLCQFSYWEQKLKPAQSKQSTGNWRFKQKYDNFIPQIRLLCRFHHVKCK